MLYFSIALVLCVALIVYKPPTITIKYLKSIEIKQPPVPQEMTTTLTEEERNKLQPPNLDDIVRSLNTALHDLGGEDE